MTLAKVMIATICILLITNLHLYKSRNSILVESGRVSEQLFEAHRVVDDVIARNANNVQQLRVAQERNYQLLESLRILQSKQNTVNKQSETKVIEVIRYAESNKESVVNAIIPSSAIDHLRKHDGLQ